MTIIKHELKQGRKSLLIWSLSMAAFMAICIFLFPEMSNDIGNIGDMFSSMGSFTEAFGMDQLNIGEYIGFYGIECGNVLAIGGAFFAALTGIGLLAKEEKEHTAEFLLTHPISRTKVIAEKYISAVVQVVLLNVIVYVFCIVSTIAIGERPDFGVITLFHVAYLILQWEICSISFGLSAIIKNGSLGIGLGMAALYTF